MVVIQKQVEEKLRTGTGPPGSAGVALIFTDVQGSTRLWDTMNATMRGALDTHHALFRRLILQYGGFEVKTEGDAFMVAFGDPVGAARFCIEAQRELMRADWAPELLTDHDAADEEYNGMRIFRGLRVRMGGELGRPSDQRDPVTGRTDYYVRRCCM
jgi:adenylate cyclase